MFTVKVVPRSLIKQDGALILRGKGSSDVTAGYKGKRYTAIYNPFAGLSCVNNIYGILPDQHRCPTCGEYVA